MTTHVEEAKGNVTAVLLDQHIAANRGDRTALAYGDRRYSYNDLAALANRCGNLFRRSRAGPGDAIWLALAPSPALCGACLGAIRIGAVAVILDTGHSAAGSALSGTQPAVVVADQARAPELSAAGAGARAVFVVGADPGPHASLVAALREMPSSLAAEKVAATAPAVVLAGRGVTLSHLDLGALIGDEQGGAGPGAGWELLPVFRAFAAGAQASLGR